MEKKAFVSAMTSKKHAKVSHRSDEIEGQSCVNEYVKRKILSYFPNPPSTKVIGSRRTPKRIN